MDDIVYLLISVVYSIYNTKFPTTVTGLEKSIFLSLDLQWGHKYIYFFSSLPLSLDLLVISIIQKQKKKKNPLNNQSKTPLL